MTILVEGREEREGPEQDVLDGQHLALRQADAAQEERRDGRREDDTAGRSSRWGATRRHRTPATKNLQRNPTPKATARNNAAAASRLRRSEWVSPVRLARLPSTIATAGPDGTSTGRPSPARPAARPGPRAPWAPARSLRGVGG